MKETMQTILFLHAVSGGIALLSGITAIATKKGSKQHIVGGNIYFWSMLMVIISGLILGFYRQNVFLQTIAVFSFYMAFTGKRALRNKKAVNPKVIDWMASLMAIFVATFMLYLAVVNAIQFGLAGVVPMLIVFGIFLLIMAVEDLRRMIKRQFVKNDWLITHIGRMGGSFIATFTAFLLVNIHFNPAWIMWVLPTVIGTPMIFSTIRKWKRKFEPKKKKN